MKPSLFSLLVDPVVWQSLKLFASEKNGTDVLTGVLTAEDGAEYPVRSGIPRFVATHDAGQLQTAKTFGYKWGRRESYESETMKEIYGTWLAEKYGFASLDEWAACYSDYQRILDLGCGSGSSSLPWLESPAWNGRAMWIGADISEAIDVAQDRLNRIENVHFVQADALALPFPDGAIDLILSEGVLHHTPSTRAAILSAARVLAAGGEFHFYVYRKKGPVREFTDDHVREAITSLNNDEAWEAMRSLTRLGQLLSETGAKIELDVDVPLLGIKSGVHDVQRLIYWSFAKLYWNPGFSFEENVHVNFDWYRPRYAHRQTEAEVRQWCAEARLSIERFHEQESGFTVRAVKR